MTSAPTTFWQWLPQPNGGDFAAIMAIAIAALIGIVSVVMSIAYRMHKNKLDDALKREMLDRGMSAEEIATVLNAGQQKWTSPFSKLRS